MSATSGEWTDMGNFWIPSSVKISDGTLTMDDTRGLHVLHAALLYTGKVLLFCGHTEVAHYATVSYVFDPDNPHVQMKPIPFPASMDLFCCHYVTLPDGRLLVIGGSLDFHQHGDFSFGANNVCFFKPDPKAGGTGKWYEAKSGSRRLTLGQDRWYPTLILTGDVEVLVFSGRTGPSETTNPARIAELLEVITLPKPGAVKVAITEFDLEDSMNESLPLLPIYPGLHLLNDGKIYFTATTWGQEIPNPNTLSIDWATGSPKKWTNYNIEPKKRRREEGMSVLLPPAQDGKILLIGGSLAVNQNGFSIYDRNINPRGNTAYRRIFLPADPISGEILETSVSTPVWNTLPDLKKPRINATCVILPDSTVLIVGGHNGFKWNASTHPVAPTIPSMECELFDGVNFNLMAPLKHPRMYHSIAILLPDGSVMAAGGANPNEEEPTLNYPQGWNGPQYGLFFIQQNPFKTFPLFQDPITNYGFFKDQGGNANLVQINQVTRVFDLMINDPRTNNIIQRDANNDPIVQNPNPPHNNVSIKPTTGRLVTIPLNQKNFEIYKPTYFFKTARPKIKGLRKNGAKSKQIIYAEELTIETTEASSITKAALMRLGCITHHTDTEQRYIALTIKSKTATEVIVKVPPLTEKNIATPGYYLLWIIDDKNIPCEKAEIVQLCVPPKTKP